MGLHEFEGLRHDQVEELKPGEHWVDSDPGDAEVGPQPDVHPCNCKDGKHWEDEQDYSEFRLAGTDVDGFALPEFDLEVDPWADLHPLIRDYAHEVADLNSEPPNMRYLNVYIVEREYGGPEEGGWWYDVGTPQGVSIVCNTISANEMQELYDYLVKKFPESGYRNSMMPQGEDYRVRIEQHPPREWPEERPYYE